MMRTRWRPVIYRLEKRRVSALSARAREAGQTAMTLVMGIVVLLTLSAGTLAATSIQHDPLVSNDVVQHLAYRALESGMDTYLSTVNANPQLINCNTSTIGANPSCPSGTLPALNTFEQIQGTGTSSSPVAEYFMWTNPQFCFNNTCTYPGKTAGLTLQYIEELVYGEAKIGSQTAFETSIVDLTPENGFLTHLFWSNFESSDPALSSNPNAASDCTYDWNNNYNGPDTTNPGNFTGSNCYAVFFGPSDTLYGPVYSNDSFYVAGGPSFESSVTTHDPSCLFVDPFDGSNGSPPSCANAATHDVTTYPSSTSSFGAAAEPIPTTDTQLATLAAQGGCLYQGPTTITLSVSGGVEQMKVTSPDTTFNSNGQSALDSATNTNVCYSSTGTVAAPAGASGDGVVFVENAPSGSCVSHANPFNSSNATYNQVGYYDGATSTPDCEGDVFVSGTVSGPLTVASQNDVIIDGNITYTTTDCGASFNSTFANQCGYNSTGSTPNDALGLIAYHFVEIDRPVQINSGNPSLAIPCGATGAQAPPLCDPGGSGLTIDAAVLALNDSFAVNNYSMSGTSGTNTVEGVLTIYGTIAQDYRGAVGTFSGTNVSTGYSKNYIWDSRLAYVNVPSYLNPGTPQWAIVSSSAKQGAICSATSTLLPPPWTQGGTLTSTTYCHPA
jgi:hypothetical protein